MATQQDAPPPPTAPTDQVAQRLLQLRQSMGQVSWLEARTRNGRRARESCHFCRHPRPRRRHRFLTRDPVRAYVMPTASRCLEQLRLCDRIDGGAAVAPAGTAPSQNCTLLLFPRGEARVCERGDVWDGFDLEDRLDRVDCVSQQYLRNAIGGASPAGY